MKTRRIQLHELLVQLFGNNNVYYRPPENLKMEYPCIRYKKDNIVSIHADDRPYHKTDRYQITVIDKKPDNEVIDKLLDLPMSSFETHYESDNLNHDIIILYY
jgi:hypothetical protein